MSTKKSLYHIGLDNQGYILKGTPTDPQRQMSRTSVFGNRFASGDRDYTDFSLWWYWAQTDWSGGIKSSTEWEDDAKYSYSTNVDAYSKQGSLVLEKESVLGKTFNENIGRGVFGTVGGSDDYYIGTSEDSGASKPIVYKSSGGTTSWSDISSASFGTKANSINELKIFNNLLWVGTFGSGDTDVIWAYDGSSWTDHSPAVETALGWTNIKKCFSIADVGGTIYASISDTANNLGIVSYDGTTWTSLVEWTDDTEIVSMVGYNGDIYYFKNDELRKYDITNSVDTLLHDFKGSFNYNNIGRIGDFLHVLNGKLVVSVHYGNNEEEVWEWDGTSLTRIFKQPEEIADLDEYLRTEFEDGGTIHNNKVYWHNLIYDGTYFYNHSRDFEESADERWNPIMSNGNSRIYYVQNFNTKGLYYDSPTVYKSGADKNFIQFSKMQEVSTIDKLANNVTLVFDKFNTGEEIEVQYSIDDGETFTVLGNASSATDGNSVTQKNILFGDNVTFKKIIFRVYLNGDGTSTPSLNDISLQYLPIPDYRYEWSLTINSNDNIKLLDNNTEFPLSGSEIRDKMRASFLKKEIIELEDIDYYETLVSLGSVSASVTTINVDSTKGFPNSGRIKIDSEEILYTGKSATTFTGCTRGYRGTPATTHTDNTTVSTGYRVLITDYGENNPVIDDENAIDYLIKIKLLEV